MANQTLKHDPRGNRITSVYDGVNQLTGQLYAARRNTFSYDPVGNRTVMADETGTYTTSYTARNNPGSVTNPDGKVVAYTYDPRERRSTMTDPDGGLFTSSYDAAGRLVTLVNPQNQTTSISYDSVDQLTAKELGNGTRTEQQFDAAGQVTVVANSKSDSTLINRFSYTYDCAGNRLTAVESSGDRSTWTYDATYQLTREQRSGAHAFDVTYSYDPVGNRLQQIDSGVSTTYSYDAANELTQQYSGGSLTTFGYDACGNRTLQDAPAGATFYSWNEDNRLTVAEPPAGAVTMSYNSDGKRVEKQAADTKKFIYDFHKLLLETDGADATQMLYTATDDEYGDLVSEFDGTDSSFHQYDALGSTDSLTNDAESVSDRYVYRAFGPEQSHTGVSASPFTFVGEQNYYRDDETSLYLLDARYLDPVAGRFVSEDPIGYRAGDENLYRYVGNDPGNEVDPSGHAPPNSGVGGTPMDATTSPQSACSSCGQQVVKLNPDFIEQKNVRFLLDNNLAVSGTFGKKRYVVVPTIENGRIVKYILEWVPTHERTEISYQGPINGEVASKKVPGHYRIVKRTPGIFLDMTSKHNTVEQIFKRMKSDGSFKSEISGIECNNRNNLVQTLRTIGDIVVECTPVLGTADLCAQGRTAEAIASAGTDALAAAKYGKLWWKILRNTSKVAAKKTRLIVGSVQVAGSGAVVGGSTFAAIDAYQKGKKTESGVRFGIAFLALAGFVPGARNISKASRRSPCKTPAAVAGGSKQIVGIEGLRHAEDFVEVGKGQSKFSCGLNSAHQAGCG